MVTLDTLPFECLYRILELSSEYAKGDIVAYRAVLGTLAAASLVARKRREAAQAQMWDELFHTRQGDLERVASSPSLGKFRTPLANFPSVNVSEEEPLAQVLGGPKGFRYLRVRWDEIMGTENSEVPEFDPAWLSIPSFAGAVPCFSP